VIGAAGAGNAFSLTLEADGPARGWLPAAEAAEILFAALIR
jgi:hypothetical protein